MVAAGDVNRDGAADIITGAGAGGGPHVQVFDGKTLNTLQSFYAYASTFSGGVSVGVADINSDGVADIITGAGAGGGSQVKVFNGADVTVLQSYSAFNGLFTGGVRVAAEDLNADGTPDVIVSQGKGGTSQVRTFDGKTGIKLADFSAYDPTQLGGVYVGGH